jgi:hypothetical protein
MNEENNKLKSNFLQVGRVVECGVCHPEKFESCVELEKKYVGFKCDCICHQPQEQEELEKRISDYFDSVFTTCCLDCPEREFHKKQWYDFVRDLLAAQKEEIIKGTRLEINNWISTDKDGNEFLSPEDLKNLIKALRDRFNQE